MLGIITGLIANSKGHKTYGGIMIVWGILELVMLFVGLPLGVGPGILFLIIAICMKRVDDAPVNPPAPKPVENNDAENNSDVQQLPEKQDEYMPTPNMLDEPAPSPKFVSTATNEIFFEEEPEKTEPIHQNAEVPKNYWPTIKLVHYPDYRSYTCTFKESVIIGRNPQADICLADLGDNSISGRHLVLQNTGSVKTATDTSTNGTYINGQRISGTVRISQGNQLRLGNSVFVISWE